MAFYFQAKHVDARSSFEGYLRNTYLIEQVLKTRIKQLQTTLPGVKQVTQKNDLSKRSEHLKAACSVYLSMRKICKTMDLSMDHLYDDPVMTEDAKKAEVTYKLMAHVLRVFEIRMNTILQEPSRCFKKVVAIPVVAGTIGGAGLAAFNRQYVGRCLKYYGGCLMYVAHAKLAPLLNPIATYVTCSASWANSDDPCPQSLERGVVAGSVALGAFGGFVVGSLLAVIIGYAMNRYYQRYHVLDETSGTIRAIDAMVEEMKTMTPDKIRECLVELADLCDTAIGVKYPRLEAHQMCQLCYKEGSEVKKPVKAPRCRVNHFMCKDTCWIPYTIKYGEICPCCRE